MNKLTQLQIFSGIFYFHLSTTSRFLTSFQVSLGLSSSSIGVILGSMRLMTSLASPMISSFSDSRKVHRTVMLCQTFFRQLPFLVLWALHAFDKVSFLELAILVSLSTLTGAGIGAISDSLILASLSDKVMYGRVRMWGALCYGLGNFLVGLSVHFTGNYYPMFACSLGSFALCVIVIYTVLPAYTNSIKPRHAITFKSVAKVLTDSWSTMAFFTHAIVFGAAMALIESLLFVAMARAMRGSSSLIMGASVLLGIAFELPLLHLAPFFLRTLGTKKMILLASCAWMVRATGYFFFSSAWVVLVLELFQGISFGLYRSASVQICVEHSPVGMECTVLALLDATYGGIGVAAGSIGGGYLFEWIGPKYTYLAFIVLVGLFTALLCIVFREHTEADIADETKSAESLACTPHAIAINEFVGDGRNSPASTAHRV